MNFTDLLIDPAEQEAKASRIAGVAIGVVTNNQDPDGLGRVKVKFPWLIDPNQNACESTWARLATPMAGNGRGIYFLPEVDDEVIVAFEHGDVRFPYVIGSLWNGKDLPPENNKNGGNHVRLIQSRSNHIIRLNDENGKEKIEIIDMSGKNSLIFDTANNTITITSDQDIILSAAKGAIKLNAQTIEIKSSADTKINADASMEVKASQTMTVKGATVNIN